MCRDLEAELHVKTDLVSVKEPWESQLFIHCPPGTRQASVPADEQSLQLQTRLQSQSRARLLMASVESPSGREGRRGRGWQERRKEREWVETPTLLPSSSFISRLVGHLLRSRWRIVERVGLDSLQRSLFKDG